MSGKHTPGPWIADYVPELRATLIGTADRAAAFARMESHDGSPSEEEQEANAQLIAAAPDYDRAAREARDFLLANYGPANGDAENKAAWSDEDARCIYVQLDAAIAKAEGRP